MTHVGITPLHPSLGAEVAGVDLNGLGGHAGTRPEDRDKYG